MKFSHSSDGGLDAFADRLELVSEEAPRALSEAMAEGIEKAIDAGFAAQSAPDGSPWEARKAPTGSWPILDRNGDMKDTRKATPDESGVDVTFALEPTIFHQHGTKKMVARPVLPWGKAAPRWTDAMDKACGDKLRAMLEGQR